MKRTALIAIVLVFFAAYLGSSWAIPPGPSGTGDMTESTYTSSGKILNSKGGTGQDSSAWTGCRPLLTSGTWSCTADPGDNDTETIRLANEAKASAATPVAGTTATFSGAVQGASFETVRGNWAQCTELHEATGGGNESIYQCAPIAATDTYKISLPAAKPAAINQSRRCSSIASDNCTEEWFTAQPSDADLTSLAGGITANNVTVGLGNGNGFKAVVIDGNTTGVSGRPVYQTDNATTPVCNGYYKSNDNSVFLTPTWSVGCQMCVRQASNKTNAFHIKPANAAYVLEPSAKTALCTAGQSLYNSGTAAVTDMLCIVGSSTENQWDTWSTSGTFTCIDTP